MAIHGNAFEAFTATSAALSLLLLICANVGANWTVVLESDVKIGEKGLWGECIQTNGQRSCESYIYWGNFKLSGRLKTFIGSKIMNVLC